MSADESLVLPPLEHIGVVVEDVDKTTKFLFSMWGLGPWYVQESAPSKEEITVGEPFKLKIAHTWLGSLLLELLQPLEGRSVWSQFLAKNGEGVHHISFNVANYEEMVSKLQGQGGIMVAGGIFNGRRWCYFDTKPGGIVIEFEEPGLHDAIVGRLQELGQ